jgi:hypothetical protein
LHKKPPGGKPIAFGPGVRRCRVRPLGLYELPEIP